MRPDGPTTYIHRVQEMRVKKEPRLMTPGEAAGYLGMTEGALKMMTKRGYVPGVIKIGERKIRYDRRKLDTWITRAVERHRIKDCTKAEPNGRSTTSTITADRTRDRDRGLRRDEHDEQADRGAPEHQVQIAHDIPHDDLPKDGD